MTYVMNPSSKYLTNNARIPKVVDLSSKSITARTVKMFSDVVKYVQADSNTHKQIKPLYREIEKLTQLPENWDGINARQISSTTGENALSFLIEFFDGMTLYEPNIVPLFDGSIQIEWEIGENYLEVNALQNGELNFYIKINELEAEGNREDVGNLLDDFQGLIVKQDKLNPQY